MVVGELADLAGLSLRELDELRRDLEVARRRVAGALASVVAAVEARRLHRADGHRSVTGWCKASAWSEVEARDHRRLGRLMAACEPVASAVLAGMIPVAHAVELGRAFANPRVGGELLEVIDVLLEHAAVLEFDDFVVVVRRWEMLADRDGAHRVARDAHRDRCGGVWRVGDEIHVRARFGLTQGAIVAEVFERFRDREFRRDWSAARAEHGDGVCVDALARTHGQRGADAIVAICHQALSAPSGGRVAVPLINVVIDIHTLDELINHHPTLSPPTDPAKRRCETSDGIPIPPDDVVAALWWGQVRRVVVDEAGVVIDLGRRQRLFTGAARDAAMLLAGGCVWRGCDQPTRRCQVDHLTEWHHHGPSDQRNASPLCGTHNRLKNLGFRITRDPRGRWHTWRPDGTEIT